MLIYGNVCLFMLVSDIDECMVPLTCSEDTPCINLRGAYRCQCPDGYKNINAATCVSK